MFCLKLFKVREDYQLHREQRSIGLIISMESLAKLEYSSSKDRLI